MAVAVVVNGRFASRPITGVERYAGEISRRLGGRVRVEAPRRGAQGLAGHLWEQITLPGQVGNALLWSPANTGPLQTTNQVVTLHDLSVIDHPEWFDLAFAGWYGFLLPRLLRRVKRIIAVSEFTRQRAIQTYHLAEEKVVVAPAGVDMGHFRPRSPQEIAEVCARYHLPGAYVLAVGSWMPRKNMTGLLQAWLRMHSKHPELELVWVGRRGPQFRLNTPDRFPPRIRMVEWIRAEDLPAIYSGAHLFVMPSLYEGFGLTNLEAMACGTPVISSNISAIPEVVGDAGLLVNPYDVDEIAGAMERVLSDGELRTELVANGLQRAAKFSYDRAAEQVWEVLSRG